MAVRASPRLIAALPSHAKAAVAAMEGTTGADGSMNKRSVTALLAAALTVVVVPGTVALSVEESSTPGPTQPSIVGTWHRAQTCEEMVAAFVAADLLESHLGWAQGNFFPEGGGPPVDDPCAGAPGPVEHDHFFTADGRFGSHDQNGMQVDDGDYTADDDVLTFPSHASEFGYPGDIVVRYVIGPDDVVTFDVLVPPACASACAEAHAWALSAFESGPWERVVESSTSSPSPRATLAG